MSNQVNVQVNVIKKKLDFAITQLCKTPQLFAKDPARDFTRSRKIPLKEVISCLLCMEGGSLTGELLRYFGYSKQTVSGSAFIQQRRKINEFAFPHLFQSFVKSTDKDKLYKGYRLLAADGSDIIIPTAPNEVSTYFPAKNGNTPYSALHLDAIYDLIQHTYVDASVCGRRNLNEAGALCKMVDNSAIQNALIIADRGYESYNLMAHIQEKGWKFLIRIKDINSSGIAANLNLPATPEFDVDFNLHFTKRQTAQARELLKDSSKYKRLYANAPFDFLPASTSKSDPLSFYYLPFRVVRFKITDSSYEVVITNLDSNDFPPEELKHLYSMRWGIETSFRQLKYTVGLLHFHAKKVENIIQEIFARLIMYNFTELITSHIAIRNSDRKHPCKANFSVAVHVCRQFLVGNVSPPDVEAIICKNISVIRSGRRNPRNSIPKHAVSFSYRIA